MHWKQQKRLLQKMKTTLQMSSQDGHVLLSKGRLCIPGGKLKWKILLTIFTELMLHYSPTTKKVKFHPGKCSENCGVDWQMKKLEMKYLCQQAPYLYQLVKIDNL